MQRLAQFIRSALLFYLAICAFMYFYQRELLYPAIGEYHPPSAHDLAAEELKLTTPDGISIAAWYLPPANSAAPVLVYFHGNAETLSSNLPVYRAAQSQGAGVMAMTYRGYPGSEGNSTEQGIYADARTTIDYLVNTQNIAPERLVLAGRSLGSGVAVQMATEYNIRQLVLISPYTSITAVAQSEYAWLPVELLLRDHFDSLTKITNITAPVALHHGTRDRLIPYQHSIALHNRAQTAKELVLYEGQTHNNIDLVAVINHTFGDAK